MDNNRYHLKEHWNWDTIDLYFFRVKQSLRTREIDIKMKTVTGGLRKTPPDDGETVVGILTTRVGEILLK